MRRLFVGFALCVGAVLVSTAALLRALGGEPSSCAPCRRVPMPLGWGPALAGEACAPHFLIAGVPKAATTSLWAVLQTHPQVLHGTKELNILDRHNFYRPWYRRRGETQLAEWMDRFDAVPRPGDCRVAAEGSPHYFTFPTIPERVRFMTPGIRIVVMLRDPVERIRSHIDMRVAEDRRINKVFGNEDVARLLRDEAEVVAECDARWNLYGTARKEIAPSFEALLAASDEKSKLLECAQSQYLLRYTAYRAAYIRWKAAFPGDQLLVVRTEGAWRGGTTRDSKTDARCRLRSTARPRDAKDPVPPRARAFQV